jgi:hypothetical protein
MPLLEPSPLVPTPTAAAHRIARRRFAPDVGDLLKRLHVEARTQSGRLTVAHALHTSSRRGAHSPVSRCCALREVVTRLVLLLV